MLITKKLGAGIGLPGLGRAVPPDGQWSDLKKPWTDPKSCPGLSLYNGTTFWSPEERC